MSADADPVVAAMIFHLGIAEQAEHKEEAWDFVWYFLASDEAIENYTKNAGVTPSLSQQQKHLASTCCPPSESSWFCTTPPGGVG